jgi:hypothetical protein
LAVYLREFSGRNIKRKRNQGVKQFIASLLSPLLSLLSSLPPPLSHFYTFLASGFLDKDESLSATKK